MCSVLSFSIKGLLFFVSFTIIFLLSFESIDLVIYFLASKEVKICVILPGVSASSVISDLIGN